MVSVRSCLLLALLLFTACSRTPQPPPPPSAEESFQQMAKVYEYLVYSKFPPPKRPADFEAYVDTMPTAFDRIQKGELVVAWGVAKSTAPAVGQQVLVYEKKTPTEGGAVLLRDGTVKAMTPEEFSKAPKAK